MVPPRIAEALARVEEARRTIRSVEGGDQVQSKAACGMLRSLAQLYYDRELRSLLPAASDEVARADSAFSNLHELSRKKPSKQKCLHVLAEAKKSLVAIEGIFLVGAAWRDAGGPSPIDGRIISTLREVCLSAAASYAQGVQDLELEDRASWRGPATELREALRETLDALAPDKDVEAMSGYKHEVNATRPTMKQKAKFILKSRGMKGAQVDHSVGVVENVEDMVSGITRSVYSRSSVSTHTPTDREEVVRLHLWVRLILCELLALPLQ
jgi:hypothetical protein